MLLIPSDPQGDGRNVTWKRGPSNEKDLHLSYCLQNAAEQFTSEADTIQTDPSVVNVIQGEVACARPGDGPVALGSDSATTCHIVAFRDCETGKTVLAHLDSPSRVSDAIGHMLTLAVTGNVSTGAIGDHRVTFRRDAESAAVAACACATCWNL